MNCTSCGVTFEGQPGAACPHCGTVSAGEATSPPGDMPPTPAETSKVPKNGLSRLSLARQTLWVRKSWKIATRLVAIKEKVAMVRQLTDASVWQMDPFDRRFG